ALRSRKPQDSSTPPQTASRSHPTRNGMPTSQSPSSSLDTTITILTPTYEHRNSAGAPNARCDGGMNNQWGYTSRYTYMRQLSIRVDFTSMAPEVEISENSTLKPASRRNFNHFEDI